MTAAQLLALLDSLEIDVAVTEGRLRVNAARGRLTDDLRAAIAEHKTALLELVGARSVESPALVRVPRTGALPVSLFQERLWVLNEFEPGNTAYNMVTGWPSNGPVDVERVREAVRGIVERHEMLRVRFQDDAGVPSVAIMPADAVSIEMRDIRDRSLDEQRAAIDAAIDEAAHRPFDLAAEIPVRFIVFRAADDWAATVMAAHHIVVDAWSLGLIGREIIAAYEGAPAPDAPELQYVDFAAWQRRTQERRAIATDLAWWTENLAGIPPVSSLPADGPRSSRAVGASHSFLFSRELSAGVRTMVREEGATVYMALLGACATVLHWYTGQEDIVLGSPMGVRERPELENIVGPFVNVLALRLGLSDDPTFAELLARARSTVLDAHAHRDVSFERLVEHLKPARSLDHAPLFQVAVVHHNAPAGGGRRIDSGGALFDLTWFVREVDGQLMGGLEYRADLYSAQTIAGVAARLEAVLTQAVADRHRRLSELSLVTPDETRRVLHELNATAREVDGASFPEQFQRQAAATPAAAALTFDGATLSYRELDERANQIARHLQGLGTEPGAVVGLCMSRSLEMVATLIGVQKTGAAYLPLDPEFPAERLSFMLGDSGARALITDGSVPAGLEVPAGVAVIDLATHSAAIAAQSTARVQTVVQRADLAYLIYTSGSTGRPKGVRVPHGALSNFLGAMRHEPGMSAADTLAAVTTLSFDIAVLELLLPLVVGARVALVPRDVAVDGERLAQFLDTTGTTILQATPATWRMLIEAGWAGRPGFRALTGGETLPSELAVSLLGLVAELWNMYGPTETTVWSTAARIEASKRITIGRPIANTRVYVLDPARRLMPVGVPGELWIGGAGVATGYHARPELTAERFLPDPFAENDGARMYRTGDSARWLADGALEHLGRLDHQVKVRGYRIELGEIESVLAAHPAVRQCVVVPRDAGSGDVRLVAYLVYASGADLSVSEVRRLLRRQLPDYMIPSLFVTLDALPLTPNGKVDRNVLPDPFRDARRTARVDRIPPAPGLEALLASIWREVLQVPEVGAEDNFFELGGHSLLTLVVANSVRARTGWRMDPRLLFFQTLRQIAAAAPATTLRLEPTLA